MDTLQNIIFQDMKRLIGNIHVKISISNKNRYKINDYLYFWWCNGGITRIFNTLKNQTIDIYSEDLMLISNNIEKIGNYNFYEDVSPILEINLVNFYKSDMLNKIEYFEYKMDLLFNLVEKNSPSKILNVIKASEINESEVLESVKSGVLYFIHDGRNAWHSTWVQRYTKGFIHTNLESAKKFIESKRVQGSVFYIIELPCLVILSDNRILYITEINNKKPLSGYSENAINENLPLGYDFVDNYKNNYLVKGSSLQNLVMSFHINSRFWKVKPKDEKNILIFHSVNHEFYETKDMPQKLVNYRSISIGKEYVLSWIAQNSLINYSYIVEFELKFKNKI